MRSFEIKHTEEKLSAFKPRKRWWRRFTRRSAVALILRPSSDGTDVLMIKRAERRGDPWSGHMAFPGGVMQGSDQTGYNTALRETREEIGVSLDKHATCIGRLSDITTPAHRGRKPMVVTPFVFTVEITPKTTNNHEVAEVLWVPLSFLADRSQRQRMNWRKGGVNMNLPCYFYRDRRIWGLSLMMLDELLKAVN